MRKLLACVIAGVFVALTSTSAQAAAITFNGQGQSGTDPWGHGWQWLNTGIGGNSVWGIPGNAAGLELFQGPGWVSDFHITFFGLPAGITIDETAGLENDLTFRVFDQAGIDDFDWTVDVDGNTVSFIAPSTAAIMNPGDDFFVNVALTGALSSFDDISFEAEWTMDVIPAPATLALMGAGLLGLGLARRRRT